MIGRRFSAASSHTDSLFSQVSQASTSSTLVESTTDLTLPPCHEHFTSHLDYTMPIFTDSVPPSPADSIANSSFFLNDSSRNLILPSLQQQPLQLAAAPVNPKQRLWLHRRRRRTSSSDTRALLSALFNSRWPRTEPEDPIFGATAPRALSPYRGLRVGDGDETVTPSRVSTPTPTPRTTCESPSSPLKTPPSSPLKTPPSSPLKTPTRSSPKTPPPHALKPAPDSPPLKPCLVTPHKSSPPPSPPPAAPAAKPRSDSPPLKSCLVSPSRITLVSPSKTTLISPSKISLTSPSKTSLVSSSFRPRPSSPSPSPRPRPHSTQSMPRSILRSDSRIGLGLGGRGTPCSVTFATRAGVRLYATPSRSSSTLSLAPSPVDEHGASSLNWYQRRAKHHDEWDAGSAVTFPPARARRSFLRRCFGREKEREKRSREKEKGKEKGPPAISAPMPLVRAASLRDVRRAREEAERRERERESEEARKRERGRLRKAPPREEAVLEKEPVAGRTGTGGRRAFWGRKTGV